MRPRGLPTAPFPDALQPSFGSDGRGGDVRAVRPITFADRQPHASTHDVTQREGWCRAYDESGHHLPPPKQQSKQKVGAR
jgi:hypothetical protein